MYIIEAVINSNLKRKKDKNPAACLVIEKLQKANSRLSWRLSHVGKIKETALLFN